MSCRKLRICLILLLHIPCLLAQEERISNKPNQRRCFSPEYGYGWCTHAARCPLPDFKKDRLRFLDYFCVIDRIYIGVCCPDKYLFSSQTGTVVIGNPHFQQNNNLGDGQLGQQLLPIIDEVTTPKAAPKPNVPPAPTTTPQPLPARRGCGLNEKQQKIRVTGGRVSDPKEWPWMAAIMDVVDLKNQFCGGVLVSERHVLSAAHCFLRIAKTKVVVRLGEHDFTRADETRVQTIPASEVKIHQQYDDITYENDIAMIRLSRDAMFNSYVWPVCLPEAGVLFNGQTSVVLGWGAVNYGGLFSDKLLEVTVPIWKNEDCARMYAQPILGSNICAGGEGGKDSCQGDSGGPLLVQLENRRWMAVGIVSWGINCGAERPAIYTRINSYLSWIIANAR